MERSEAASAASCVAPHRRRHLVAREACAIEQQHAVTRTLGPKLAAGAAMQQMATLDPALLEQLRLRSMSAG